MARAAKRLARVETSSSRPTLAAQTEPGPEDFELVQPNAPALIESLRAFGYTPEAAIADLVDNSIAAHAKDVWLTLYWAGGDSYVSVRDNGRGMDALTLREAMRAGGRSPLEERDPNDLGRFGLGLKTASFSQARCLTVRSRVYGRPAHTRRWDLDYVNETGDWRLLKSAGEGSESRLNGLSDLPSGTVVLWEKMDRLAEDFDIEDERAHRRFLQMIRDVEQHLAMVFHRYLARAGGLRIFVNEQLVNSWDPFLTTHAATQRLAGERLELAGKVAWVQPFVLPHHSKLGPELHAGSAGPRGWNAQQGFYIYRNQRLLVAGDWLGLGFQKEEHYKLARIQVDVPNSMDHEWRIDVKKSRAQPPGAFVDDLRRIAKLTRERAVEVYRHRGKIIARRAADKLSFVWVQEVKGGKVRYRVNRAHPLVVEVLKLPPAERRLVAALLRLIEETTPVPLIAIDNAERPDEQAIPFEKSPKKEVLDVLVEVYRALRRTGLTHSRALERLVGMEPFQHYPELVAALPDQA